MLKSVHKFFLFVNMTSEVKSAAASSKKKSPVKSKSKTASSHPPTNVMVVAAIKALKERKGSSTVAIKKYIAANYKVDIAKINPFIRKALKSGVEKKVLIQVKGTGASGSFKLATSSLSSTIKKVDTDTKKKATAKKSSSTTQKKSPKKKTVVAEKKVNAPKKSAATPKKPAAKKSTLSKKASPKKKVSKK